MQWGCWGEKKWKVRVLFCSSFMDSIWQLRKDFFCFFVSASFVRSFVRSSQTRLGLDLSATDYGWMGSRTICQVWHARPHLYLELIIRRINFWRFFEYFFRDIRDKPPCPPAWLTERRSLWRLCLTRYVAYFIKILPKDPSRFCFRGAPKQQQSQEEEEEETCHLARNCSRQTCISIRCRHQRGRESARE